METTTFRQTTTTIKIKLCIQDDSSTSSSSSSEDSDVIAGKPIDLILAELRQAGLEVQRGNFRKSVEKGERKMVSYLLLCKFISPSQLTDFRT